MCQILTNPNTFHKPMGSLGQTPSLCFTAVINIQFSFIPKAGGFTDRTALWSSSTHQRTKRGGKKMTQETWMSSRGSSKLPRESQKSNSCLEPRFAWHRVHQRSIDRTRAEKGGTPTCLTLCTSSNATLFDQRSECRGNSFSSHLFGVESFFFPWFTASLRRYHLKIHQQHRHKSPQRLTWSFILKTKFH